MSDTDLEELAGKVDQSLAAYATRRTFEEARAALNEAGMNKARQRLSDTLAGIESAQGRVRQMQELEKLRRRAVDQAIAEADWELDDLFETVGNKTYLAEGADLRNGERKAMTADERKAWKQAMARRRPAVVDAEAYHAGAESELNAAKDALVVAELGFRAARADLDAAIATVQTLATGIRKQTDND